MMCQRKVVVNIVIPLTQVRLMNEMEGHKSVMKLVAGRQEIFLFIVFSQTKHVWLQHSGLSESMQCLYCTLL